MARPLYDFRQKAELSLKEAGALFGVDKTTFMRWEAGRVPAERALEVERVTGVSRHALRPDIYGPLEQAVA